MQVEIVYLEPELEFVERIEVSAQATVLEAIQSSRLLEKNMAVSLEKNNVGIFGKQVTLQTILQPDDRIEVYRALKKDPKESRRLRASSQYKD